MATGRMIQRKISLNKAVNDLSSDTSRLAFTWAITHLDVNGRIQGDPEVLKSIIFPRRKDISAAQMEEFIIEWYKAGLVQWYRADGDLWLSFPKFPENQKGLRKEREAKPYIPSPENGELLPEDFRSYSGVTPSQINVMEINVNLNNSENSQFTPDVIRRTSGVTPEDEIPFEESPSLAPAEPIKEPSKKTKHSPEKIKLAGDVYQDFSKVYGDISKKDRDMQFKHIYDLIDRAVEVAPGGEREFIRDLIRTLLALKKTKDDFWKSQPILPSTLNSKGIYPRLLEYLKQPRADPTLMNLVDSIIPRREAK